MGRITTTVVKVKKLKPSKQSQRLFLFKLKEHLEVLDTLLLYLFLSNL